MLNKIILFLFFYFVILMGKSKIEGFAIGLMFVPMVFPIVMIAFVLLTQITRDIH